MIRAVENTGTPLYLKSEFSFNQIQFGSFIKACRTNHSSLAGRGLEPGLQASKAMRDFTQLLKQKQSVSSLFSAEALYRALMGFTELECHRKSKTKSTTGISHLCTWKALEESQSRHRRHRHNSKFPILSGSATWVLDLHAIQSFQKICVKIWIQEFMIKEVKESWE